MKNVNANFRNLFTGMLFLGFFGCVEDPFENDLLSRSDANPNSKLGVIGEGDLRNNHGIGTVGDDLTDHPNPTRLPNPTIIHQTFIPSYSLWNHTKCLTWRISWPIYNQGVTENAKPTVFNRHNGALNSFNFLNNVDPLNTINSTFSLYRDEKVEGSIQLNSEGLNHVPFGGVGMEYVKFAKVNFSVNTIKHWVEDRPSNFEAHMPELTSDHLTYNEGDIILYKILGENLYGGIRIVSMSPRIIEVYQAVPNI